MVTPTRSSLGEGHCLTAVESLALGRPLIAPRFRACLYGMREAVEGIVYEPYSITDLRRALNQVITDHRLCEQLRLGAAACSNVYRPPELTFGKAFRPMLRQIGLRTNHEPSSCGVAYKIREQNEVQTPRKLVGHSRYRSIRRDCVSGVVEMRGMDC